MYEIFKQSKPPYEHLKTSRKNQISVNREEITICIECFRDWMTVMMRLLISVFLCTVVWMNESNPFNIHKCISKDNQVDESLVERCCYLSKFVLCHPFTVGSAFSSMNTPMCFILADLVAIKFCTTIIDESIIRK